MCQKLLYAYINVIILKISMLLIMMSNNKYYDY